MNLVGKCDWQTLFKHKKLKENPEEYKDLRPLSILLTLSKVLAGVVQTAS